MVERRWQACSAPVIEICTRLVGLEEALRDAYHMLLHVYTRIQKAERVLMDEYRNALPI